MILILFLLALWRHLGRNLVNLALRAQRRAQILQPSNFPDHRRERHARHGQTEALMRAVAQMDVRVERAGEVNRVSAYSIGASAPPIKGLGLGDGVAIAGSPPSSGRRRGGRARARGG